MRTRHRPARRPIITLTSDFGLSDAYVAQMKAALLQGCPQAQLVDVTHLVPRHDVLAGSILLERAIAAFPARTVHVAVLDPGVGSERRLIVATVRGQTIVCPDNGLISWSVVRHGASEVRELTGRPRGDDISNTFHGRDILAPAAAKLASGTPMRSMGRRIEDPVLLDVELAGDPSRGTIIHIDSFGNATSNIPCDSRDVSDIKAIHIHGRNVGPLRRTYTDVALGKPLALVGSAGLLEIAVREGSALKMLGICVGDGVRVKYSRTKS